MNSDQSLLEQSRKESTRVTVVGMVLDILLGVAKIVGGLFSQSFALVTDGIHSLTDAVTDIFVLIMARLAHNEADDNHPYGHGRFETLGTVGMGMVFFATAGVILYDAFQRLQSSVEIPVPALTGLLFALASIAAKEWIYHYTMAVARKLNSGLLKANAWHSRSDAITSIAVFIGIVAAQQGYAWMDTVAAAVVALFIARMGFDLCLDAIRELVDTAVPVERQQQIQESVRSVEGIRGLSSLRSRSSGGKLILELHLLVDPRITVSEGHQLGSLVSRQLIGQFSDIADVIIHIDPEDLEHGSPDPRNQLPERSQLLDAVRSRWQGLLADEDIQRVDLHYLEQGVEIELLLRKPELPEDLPQRLAQALEDIDSLSGLRVYGRLFATRDQRQ